MLKFVDIWSALKTPTGLNNSKYITTILSTFQMEVSSRVDRPMEGNTVWESAQVGNNATIAT